MSYEERGGLLHNPAIFEETGERFASCCAGKERYSSRGEARKTIKRMEQRAKRRYRTGTRKGQHTQPTPYHCDYCGGWHLGRKHSI